MLGSSRLGQGDVPDNGAHSAALHQDLQVGGVAASSLQLGPHRHGEVDQEGVEHDRWRHQGQSSVHQKFTFIFCSRMCFVRLAGFKRKCSTRRQEVATPCLTHLLTQHIAIIDAECEGRSHFLNCLSRKLTAPLADRTCAVVRVSAIYKLVYIPSTLKLLT